MLMDLIDQWIGRSVVHLWYQTFFFQGVARDLISISLVDASGDVLQIKCAADGEGLAFSRDIAEEFSNEGYGDVFVLNEDRIYHTSAIDLPATVEAINIVNDTGGRPLSAEVYFSAGCGILIVNRGDDLVISGVGISADKRQR